MRHALTPVFLLVFGCAASPAVEYDVEITLENRTGADKADWPVFLTVWKVFGGNLDLRTLNPDGFHVYGPDGKEIFHMRRKMPPDFSIGNDELILFIPKMAAGEAQRFRITNTDRITKFRALMPALAGNPNNLIPNGGFEMAWGGEPAGWRPVSDKGARVSLDQTDTRDGRSLCFTFPIGTAATIETADEIAFKKDCPYYFSVWAKTENMSYNGYGMNGSAVIRFKPDALRGRSELRLRDTRPWYCYKFDAGGKDDWGIDEMCSKAQSETVRQGRSEVDAEIWAKAGGKARLSIGGYQDRQPFLKGDGTGRIWLDDLLLLEQPVVTVKRADALKRAAKNGAAVFVRPVQMPRIGAAPHEAADKIEAFAMRGERRQVRFGIHAVDLLENVEVEVSALMSRGAAITESDLELELLDHFVEPYRPVHRLNPGKQQEYLLGIDVPANASPGAYKGAVTFKASGREIAHLPLTLDVLPLNVEKMSGFWVGGIFNIGMGLDRDKAFYREYGKARFNYLLLFDYLFSYSQDGRLDFEAAQKQVDDIVKIAHVDGGIGLYREPNMSEDQPRKWYQVASGNPEWQGKYKIGTDAKFKAAYQTFAKSADEFARQHRWPELLYMVSDEPDGNRDVDPSMGWLNEALPNAVTIADVQFKDMLNTWQWYNLPVFDDPMDWTGPLLYEWMGLQKTLCFGFCGTGWSLEVGRYQPGLMLASSRARYWHWWHVNGPFRSREGRVERSHTVAAMAAGVNDLRYYYLLEHLMSKQRWPDWGPEAQSYLKDVFTFASADHDRHLMPYNGVPHDWGYDRFYDDWRAKMKDFLLKK